MAQGFRGVCFPPDVAPNFQVNFPPPPAGNCAGTDSGSPGTSGHMDEKGFEIHRLYLDFIELSAILMAFTFYF